MKGKHEGRRRKKEEQGSQGRDNEPTRWATKSESVKAEIKRTDRQIDREEASEAK